MTASIDPVDRAGDADLAFLAMDRGPVPEQLAAVLVLDGRIDAARLLGERVAAVPRLRQRLMATPPGCGTPIWVDDPAFTPGRHVGTVWCAAPGDDQALLDTALRHVLRRLPRDRPLWRAVVVDGLAGGRTAVVLVVHHVLSDGLGGLAVLEQLVDGATPVAARPARPRPTSRRLARDARRSRVRALVQTPVRLRRLRTAMRAGGGLSPVKIEACSLLARTGARRRAVVVRVPVAPVRVAAHRHGATVNSALLTAVAAALRQVLSARGETIGAVTMAVPVGAPRAAGVTGGNAVAPLLVTVPVTGPIGGRLARVAADVRRDRGAAAGPAPIAVLGGLFRLLAAVGGYGWYMTHQRRMHTLVSLVRGPQRPVRLGGVTVCELLPIAVGGPTNITVMFEAVTYAGMLTVTVIADPDRVSDLDLLRAALESELAAIAAGSPIRG